MGASRRGSHFKWFLKLCPTIEGKYEILSQGMYNQSFSTCKLSKKSPKRRRKRIRKLKEILAQKNGVRRKMKKVKRDDLNESAVHVLAQES